MRIRGARDRLTLRVAVLQLYPESYQDEQAVTALQEALLSGKTIRILDGEDATYEFHVEMKGA